jgi:hypothetical protein
LRLKGLLFGSSSALGGQSLDMALDITCGRRSARDSSSSSQVMAQSSSQSSQQTSINADDESASPLTACPSFGSNDFKSGIPSNNTLGIYILLSFLILSFLVSLYILEHHI